MIKWSMHLSMLDFFPDGCVASLEDISLKCCYFRSQHSTKCSFLTKSHEIGRDSWVWEVTWDSVQKPRPKNCGGNTSSLSYTINALERNVHRKRNDCCCCCLDIFNNQTKRQSNTLQTILFYKQIVRARHLGAKLKCSCSILTARCGPPFVLFTYMWAVFQTLMKL